MCDYEEKDAIRAAAVDNDYEPMLGLVACTSFIRGVLDMYWAQKAIDLEPFPLCYPLTATPYQFKEVFLNFMGQHPEGLHEGPSQWVLLSLLTAFPCEDPPQPQ